MFKAVDTPNESLLPSFNFPQLQLSSAHFGRGVVAEQPLLVIYHFNMAIFPRSSAVITDDYCHVGHLPSINKAEERWQQVATLTPTARLDIEESRFRPVRATIGG